jgi:EmrB/QacA subfamily drug resistance transporter
MTASRQHYNVTLAVLALAATTYALQQTMVVPALPVLQEDLDTSTTWITWVFTGFLLSAAVLTPILGKLGDRFGKERLLVLSLGCFFVGTIGCAFAWDVGSLIAFRIASGAGGAVFPLSFGIIRDEFPPEKVKVGMGLLSAVFGIGGGFGLVVSGLIIDNASWRWLFVAGAVPVAFATLLVHRFVPESPVRSPSRIDVPGAVLLSATLVALLLPLTEGADWGWTSPATLGLFAASVVFGALFVLVELRASAPLLDMHVFVERPVLLTNVTAVITGFALFGAFSLVPRFVETPAGLGANVASQVDYGFGASATRAGLYLIPMSLTMLVAGPVGGMLGRRLGSKWPLSIGMAMIAAASVLLAVRHDEPWQIMVAMILLGVGAAFSFASMPALITDAVDRTETGIATGINTVMRTVGAVIGGQVGASILTASTIVGTSVPTERAYSAVFVLAGAVAAVGAIVAAFATRGAARATPATAAA